MAANDHEATKKDLSLIFSYGTLKRGLPNHVLMEELMATDDVSFKGVYRTVEGFPLVIGPFGIPYMINKSGSGHRISGELYSVTARGMERLDELEGIKIGHYERLPVKVVEAEGGGESVAVEAYFAHRSFAEKLWRKCGEVDLSEYSLEMSKKYVKKSDRPLESNFVDAIWNFISSDD